VLVTVFMDFTNR